MLELAEVFAEDSEPSPGAALTAPRCTCLQRLVITMDDLCVRCGREVRREGAFGRELRRAAYKRELMWARGEGLDPETGFRGLRRELGVNPPVDDVHGALSARLAVLPTPEALQVA